MYARVNTQQRLRSIWVTKTSRYHVCFGERPFGLRLLLPFWRWREGVLVHGWCAEMENKGKGGSGQGKIGAKVVREWVLPDP
jgi:hypothetical protein